MNKEKILKIGIKCLLVLSLFIPLFFYKKFFFPFVTTKALSFRLIVEIAFVLFVVYFFLKKKINFHKSPVWWGFVVLTIAILVSGLFGVNPYNSFWSNMERAEGGVFWIHLLIYFSLLIFVFKTKQDFRLLFRASLISGFMVVAYGLMQNFGWLGAVTTSGARMSSTLGNAAYLGSYMLINTFFALYLLLLDRNVYWRIFYGVMIFLGFTAVFMTQTRGAILGLLGGLILTALLTVIKAKNKKVKLSSFVVIALIIVFISSIFLFKNSSLIKNTGALNKIASISTEDYTTQTRLVAWEAAVRGFADKPIFGWGGENYNYAFSKYFPPEIYTDTDSRLWFDKAHSVLFEYLVTTGIVGTLSYFGLLVLSIIFIFKNKNLATVEKNLFVGLLAGYTFANMFVFDTVNTYVLFAVVLAFISNTYYLSSDSKELKFEKFTAIGVAVLLLILIPISVNTNYLSILSNNKILKAEAYNKSGYIEEAHNAYLAAIENNNNPTRFEIRQQFALFVQSNYSSQLDYLASDMFDDAIAAILKNIEEDPDNIKNYYNLNQLYLRSYKFNASRLDKIIELEDKMISLGEERAHTYYQIGEAYFRKGDYDMAIEKYQKAVEINPNLVDPYINVFVTAVMSGNEELEQEVVKNILDLEPDYFNREEIILRFVPMFKKVNRTERVINDLERLISIDSSKIEYYSSLAMQYAELGKNQKAEEVISQLLGRDLELDKKVEEFIEKIYSGEFRK